MEYNYMEYLLSLLLLFVFFILPFLLTFKNIAAFVKIKNSPFKKVREKMIKSISGEFKPSEDAEPDTKLSRFFCDENSIIDVFTLIFGLFCSLLLACITLNLADADYDEAVYHNSLHNILHSEYGNTIGWIIAAALTGLILICLIKPKKLPPIVSAVSIAMTIIGIIAGLFILIQFAANFDYIHLFVCLYYFNVILIAIRRIHFHITEHVRLINERQTAFRSKFAEKLYKIMSRVSTMTMFCFLLMFPIAAVFEVIFILCGQGPDGFIKAFTMTADWTFSTQVPPPPLEYEGHYLCTVAAGGHEKVVKPLRYGKRLGRKIIVNRQLLTANAFEDLIKEKLPCFHRRIRGFYDKYGYPISKHITTRQRADIVYFIMKPLEYVFLIVLYLCDSHPENRIAVQYSDYKLGN